MHCRRCQSLRLIPLDKKQQDDNDVFRCQECGYLFSPPSRTQLSLDKEKKPRTTAIESGYLAQR